MKFLMYSFFILITFNSSFARYYSDQELCRMATFVKLENSKKVTYWFSEGKSQKKFIKAAKARGLSCGVVEKITEQNSYSSLKNVPDREICFDATYKSGNKRVWIKISENGNIISSYSGAAVASINAYNEAKKRGIDCESSSIYINDKLKKKVVQGKLIPLNAYASGVSWKCKDGYLKKKNYCEKMYIPENAVAFGEQWFCKKGFIRQNDKCLSVISKNNFLGDYKEWPDKIICDKAWDKYDGNWTTDPDIIEFVQVAKNRNLDCNPNKLTKQKKFNNTLALQQANQKAQQAQTEAQVAKQLAQQSEQEAQKAKSEAEQLKQQLAKVEAEKQNLLAQQKQQQQQITQDNQIPLIDILSSVSSGKQGIIKGRATDNVEVAEVTIDGKTIPIDSNGYFEHTTYIREGGTTLTIEAFDMAGLSSMVNVSLERNDAIVSNAITFDPLNPLGKTVSQNNDALALIIGVSDYENINAQAIYADSDAKIFSDYATDILGIPSNRIKTLVNDGADIRDVLLGIKNWLRRSTKPDQSDVYLFFAGHGLASDDGEDMYLLPYDGSPEILDRTAILRKELYEDIASTNPRSVTVFLDTCYSGTTRGTDMLIASRPIAIVAKEQAIPDNFTVFTAAAGDQTAKPLEEAKHGLFSYFLMKGMEGEADSNKDNTITAGELHAYIQQNVIQQSSGSQTPELQGDAKRVLVQFQ